MGSQKVTVQITGTQRLLSEGPEVKTAETEGGRGEEPETKRGETEHTQLTASGIYSCRNGVHFVLYDEDDGEGHATRSTMKIVENVFEVTRKGAGGMHMVFRPGERWESRYDTPYGRIPVVFDVRETEICLPPAGEPATDRPGAGVILLARADYILEIYGEAVFENTLVVRVCGG